MSLSVLFVDDETDLAEIYPRMFSRHGFSDVTFASDARSALEYIETHKPGLVFLDINLNHDELDGMKILKRVRETTPETRICMMSAYHGQYEEDSISLGAFGFMHKPVHPPQLLDLARLVENEMAK